MDDETRLGSMPRPNSRRPLLGLTVLVVEDSRYACDAMRLMCLRSGARIRRADCLASARRHLQVYRPSVIIVDLGLPDGSGADLIAELCRSVPRIGVILATSGDSFAEDVALAAGADGFLAKPMTSLPAFQAAVIEKLPPEMRPSGPRTISAEPICPDPISYRDDMAHAAELLRDGMEPGAIRYVTQFLGGVARSAGDHVLENAAADLASVHEEGTPHAAAMARLSTLVQDRVSDRIAI